MTGTLQVWPHYKVEKLDDMAAIREIFPGGTADTLNWLFCSTSGVHGSYTQLDDLHKVDPEYPDEPVPDTVTVLVVHPRLVVIRWGEIEVTPEDVEYLRGLVSSTLEAVAESQEGNTKEA